MQELIEHPLLTRIQERNFCTIWGEPILSVKLGAMQVITLYGKMYRELNEPVLVFEDHVNIDENIFRNTLAIAEQTYWAMWFHSLTRQ